MSDLGTSAAAPPRFVHPPDSSAARQNVGQTERLASGLGGGLLVLYGLSRRSLGGLVLAGIGGAIASRGATGHCPAYQALGVDTNDKPGESAANEVEIVESVTVTSDADEAYGFWRKLENLPRFMEHLRSVEALDDKRSRWTAKGPGALPDLTWEAEIVQDEPGRLLVWRSLPGADVDNAGHVRFEPAPHGGTEVHARIGYRPPAGPLGATLARWLDPVLGQMVRNDIRRFKHLLETGEVPTTEGQSKGA